KRALKYQNMIKKRPKQNFDVNYSQIRNSELNPKEQNILMTVLEFHKANCKFEYKNMLNDELCNKAGLSENTMLKYRKLLIQDNYFELKKIRNGKSFVLQYRFNWSKLLKQNFITSIE